MKGWIQSLGGPLVALPAGLAPAWGGAEAGREGRSDYSRACEIDGHLGLVGIAGGFALVLADEPLLTTWLPGQDGEPMIARWRYAECEASALAACACRDAANALAPPLRLSCLAAAAGDWLLFDAATPGTEAASSDRLLLRLGPGEYEVLTETCSPDPRTSMLVHRFVRVTGAGLPRGLPAPLR